MDYDVIGDIHGDATRLRALLRKLGHRETASGFVAPAGRQAVFVGDLIDRGPGQLEVLDIVRRMVDRGDARCVLGNHELNAVGWLTERDGARAARGADPLVAERRGPLPGGRAGGGRPAARDPGPAAAGRLPVDAGDRHPPSSSAATG